MLEEFDNLIQYVREHSEYLINHQPFLEMAEKVRQMIKETEGDISLDELTMSLIEQYGWNKQVIIDELIAWNISFSEALDSYNKYAEKFKLKD